MVALGYDAADRPAGITFPNGFSTGVTYDTAGHLSTLAHTRGGIDLASFDYGYNALGSITQIAELTQTRDFAYDELLRLTSGGTASAPESYAYDAEGNLGTPAEMADYLPLCGPKAVDNIVENVPPIGQTLNLFRRSHEWCSAYSSTGFVSDNACNDLARIDLPGAGARPPSAAPDVDMGNCKPMTANNGLDRVISSLEEDIVFGRRRPRERLIEEDLVSEFGAKKHVVRHALAELERMGLVERKRNKGACVRDYTPEDVQKIYAVRELLEAEAARQIPLPVPKPLIESLTRIYREHSEAVNAGDLARAFRINIRFHQTLFGACGNPYLVEAINSFAFKSHAVRSFSLVNPDMLRNARKDHAAMIDALKKGERAILVELCVNHLKPPVKAYTDAYQKMFGPDLRRSA